MKEVMNFTSSLVKPVTEVVSHTSCVYQNFFQASAVYDYSSKYKLLLNWAFKTQEKSVIHVRKKKKKIF